jgi:hypothetical protein
MKSWVFFLNTILYYSKRLEFFGAFVLTLFLKNMHKKIYSLLFIVLTFASCTNQEAVKFNDDFIDEQSVLQKTLNPIDEKIAQFTIQQNFDSIAVQAELAEKAITKTIKKFENAPTPNINGAADYKKAFAYYYGNIKDEYSYYKYYAQETKPKLKQEYFDKLKAKVNRRMEWDIYIHNAQNAYAKANGFRVQNSLFQR